MLFSSCLLFMDHDNGIFGNRMCIMSDIRCEMRVIVLDFFFLFVAFGMHDGKMIIYF